MSSKNTKKNTIEEAEAEKAVDSDSPTATGREEEKAPSFEEGASALKKEVEESASPKREEEKEKSLSFEKSASSEQEETEEKKKYIVHSIRIRHKGKNYSPGELIELTQEEAQPIKKYIKERN